MQKNLNCEKCPNFVVFCKIKRCDCHYTWINLKKAVTTCNGQHDYYNISCRRCAMSQYVKLPKTQKTVLCCEVFNIKLQYNEEVGMCGHFREYTAADKYKLQDDSEE